MLVQLMRTFWPELRATWPNTRVGIRSTMDRPRPSRPAQQDVDVAAVLQHVPPWWSTRWSGPTDETATGSRRDF